MYFENVRSGSEEIITSFSGGYVLMTDTRIHSLNFNSETIFKKDFANVTLKKIFLVPKKFLIVQFENQSYFEIYDYNTGELLDTKRFDKNVKFILSTIRDDHAFNYTGFEGAYLMVVLENSSIHKFIFNESSLNLQYVIPSSGIEVHSCNIYIPEEILKSQQVYTLTYEDGGYCVIQDKTSKYTDANFEFKGSMNYFRPKQKGKCEPLKLIFFTNYGMTFVNKSGHIYFMFKHEENLRVIPGEFDTAKLTSDNNVVAISKGNLAFFHVSEKIDSASSTFKAVNFLNLETQFDQISYFEFSGVLRFC